MLHTPMPMMPLTQMVADMAHVMVDVNGQGRTCCFYGWGETIDSPSCLPHHLVTCEDNQTLKWLAHTLKAMGEQVVVTEHDDWSVVIDSAMPMLYDGAHDH
jgi:hypothetical protein